MFTDSKGRMWIASSVSGLTRVDDPTSERPVFSHYTIADGLTSNNIRCITEDLFGNIYVGTVRGVNRISPETGHVKYYGTGDGLAGDFVSAAHRDRDGAIWFGTFSGLSKLIPEPDVTAPAPPTLISGLRIAGVDFSVSPLGQTEVSAPEQAANRNNLQIDFFSVNVGGSDSVRYRYKLEGADQNWSTPATQRTVTFANLRPASYRLLVEAVNADGVAGLPALLTFRILPPIWQRWWFITIAALLIIGAVIGLDRYRVARARELSAALTVSQDLTEELTEKGRELSRANRTLALDYEVTRILAESATPGEAAPQILQAICLKTDWDIGALWYVDDEASVLRCAEVWRRPEIDAGSFKALTSESVFPPGVGLPGRVWQAAEPRWINELAKDSNFPRLSVAAQIGLQSAFAFPILLGSEVIGVGEFFSRQSRERDDEMLAMLAAIGSDIGQLIERKQKEEALRESEDRFRTLAETASDAIITIDENGLIVFANPAVEKVFGYQPAEMLGQDLTMLMPEYLRHLHRAGLQRYQDTGKKHISWEAVELPGLHRNGREIPLELSFGEFVRNERRYFTGIARDVSERRQAAAALQKSREERFRELERVRQRIATDLHDDIGSSLTQISIMSEVAQNRSDGDNAPALSMIANSSRELIDAMSDIVWAINPKKDHLSDLNQRMRRFAADVLTARNVELDFRAPVAETDLELGANIRREVFLIFKETVNNMVKHSGLTRAEIEFRIADGNLVLRVSDNGKGFDTNSDSDGHGLMSIRERTAALGGKIEIGSTPGQGTTVILRAPLDANAL
jgi:PAS domain S-box-containing protein